MKKILNLILIISLILFLTKFSSAQQDIGDASQVLSEQFGLNKSQIPTNPEAIKQKYLQMQWTDFIAKNRILGPLHELLTKMSPVFQVLIAYPYEISLTFFGIIVLWFMLGAQAAKIIEGSGIIKQGWFSFMFGMLFAVILAQVGVIKIIATFILDLIFKQENWWIRLIVIVIFIAILIIENKFSQMLSKNLKERQAKKVKEGLEQELNKAKRIEKGRKEVG